MRGVPRWSMLHLAQAIMIACVAALGTALRAEGAPPRFIPGLRLPEAWITFLTSTTWRVILNEVKDPLLRRCGA
jgi:hypothetical protein